MSKRRKTIQKCKNKRIYPWKHAVRKARRLRNKANKKARTYRCPYANHFHVGIPPETDLEKLLRKLGP